MSLLNCHVRKLKTDPNITVQFPPQLIHTKIRSLFIIWNSFREQKNSYITFLLNKGGNNFRNLLIIYFN